jgi:hypothetical protein
MMYEMLNFRRYILFGTLGRSWNRLAEHHCLHRNIHPYRVGGGFFGSLYLPRDQAKGSVGGLVELVPDSHVTTVTSCLVSKSYVL